LIGANLIVVVFTLIVIIIVISYCFVSWLIYFNAFIWLRCNLFNRYLFKAFSLLWWSFNFYFYNFLWNFSLFICFYFVLVWHTYICNHKLSDINSFFILKP